MQIVNTHPLIWLPDEWREALTHMGERPFRSQQIFQWIHRRNVQEPAQMTDVPTALREKLVQHGLTPVASIETVHRSADDTRKVLVRFHDATTVETVLIPEIEDDDELDEDGSSQSVRRVTQCISTQVGCAMGCVFCASGVAGLKRNLKPEEIVAQVLIGKTLLEEGEELRNVVFMGMGEPLHNYEATARALRVLTCPLGINLSNRRVTISTSGLVPQIDQLGQDFNGQVTLAVSLHATTDEKRSTLMPINKKYPLIDLMAALHRYPLPKRRRIFIEYTLINGQNDSFEDAKQLTHLLRGLPVKINLIPMNPISASTLNSPNHSRVIAFQKLLIDAGYTCFIRRRRGDDVDAACGQLALLGAAPKVKRAFSTTHDASIETASK